MKPIGDIVPESLVLTEGWYPAAEVAGRLGRWTSCQFALRVAEPSRGLLRMEAWLPEDGRIPALQLEIVSGGRSRARWPLRPGQNWIETKLSGRGCGDVVFRLSESWTPSDLGIGDDRRKLGVLVFSIAVAPPRGRSPRRAPRTLSGERALRASRDPYREFGERFRGSFEEIRSRQRAYLRFFQGRWNVLDLGCGRGEFLQILEEEGIGGWGVDSDPACVESCRARGLRAVEGDAVSYLESLRDGGLDGIFSAQMVEHLDPRTRRRLIETAARKLRPGGIVILETVNPKCLSVFSGSFYLDPTHHHPIPPELLEFEAESAGLKVAEIVYSSPVEEADRLPPLPPGQPGDDREREVLESWRRRLNDLLFGDRDYAVIGLRPDNLA